jgi:hypothetical protein
MLITMSLHPWHSQGTGESNLLVHVENDDFPKN